MFYNLGLIFWALTNISTGYDNITIRKHDEIIGFGYKGVNIAILLD